MVVHCSAKLVADPKRYSTLGAMIRETEMRGFIPAALLAQKAKSVSDGIVAALDILSNEGSERGMGVHALVTTLCVDVRGSPTAQEYLAAAFDLWTRGAAAGARADAFFASPVRSKPIGFYAWSESLERIFRRDRFLQQPLAPDEAEPIARAIADDERLRAAYVHHLGRIARLTNRLSKRVHSLAGRIGPPPAGEVEAVFPPSWTVENDFSSIDKFVQAVQAGACDLTPTSESGFYAHQLFALSALLRPGATSEAPSRTIDPEYAIALERLATFAHFFARETHVKQLELPGPVMPASLPSRWILPDLTIEPVPTFYARTADAFRFLRGVIDDGWGDSALRAPQLRETGPIAATIADGIDEIIALSDAAANLSRRELTGAATGAEPDALRMRLAVLCTDPDAIGDARGMAPTGMLDDKGQKLRALVFLGWEVQELRVSVKSVAHLPPGVGLGGERHPLPLPLVREVHFDARDLLDRNELRRTCDRLMGAHT
jgi:hypothetical protein